MKVLISLILVMPDIFATVFPDIVWKFFLMNFIIPDIINKE